ncbi:MAG: hypothetical protein COB37_06005 [Kordiimonadales bacterium]|nr:MAG: hypothetical protein COB37_06005 [Kordiimonadales bacterium]
MADAAMKQQDSKFDMVTLSSGYWFAFDCDGDEITVHGSAFSGKERVYINDALVFEKRSFRYHSRHKFPHAGHDYEVHFSTVSVFKASIECLVIKNGSIVGVKTAGYYVGSKSKILKKMLVPVSAGLLAGLAGATIGLDWSGYFEEIPFWGFLGVLAGALGLLVAGVAVYWHRLRAKEQRDAASTGDSETTGQGQ